MKCNFEKIMKWLILGIFSIIIVIMTAQSVFCTAYMSTSEHTYYASDKPIRHLIVFVFLLGLCIFFYFLFDKIKWKIASHDMNETQNKINILARLDNVGMLFFFGIAMVAGFLIFYYTQLYPRSDQRLVLLAASQFREGDFSSMEPGGYLALWPHQMGTVIYHYFLTFLTGSNSHVGMQIWNIVMLGIFFVSFGALTKIMYEKLSKTVIMMVNVSFLPLIFYVSFVYGNIAGLAFSTIALLFLFFFVKNHKWWYIAISGMALWISFLIKGNYLIVMIACLIYLLIDFISNKKKQTLIFIAVILLCIPTNHMFIEQVTMKVTGKEVPQGVPTVGWIAMGLQDGYAAKGWFNTYVSDIFDACEQDTAKVEKKAIEDIQKRIEEFRDDSVMARQFFGEKMVSQWNNPTFQCFWIFYDRTTDRQVPALMKNILTGNIRNKLISLMNIWQTQILIGVCLYIVFRWKKASWQELILALCFVGGFLFHMFLWEAKCQYTLSYFVLLLPYSTMGFYEITCSIRKCIEEVKKISEKKVIFQCLAKEKSVRFLIALSILMICGMFINSAFFIDTIKINKDDDRFEEKVTPVEVDY